MLHTHKHIRQKIIRVINDRTKTCRFNLTLAGSRSCYMSVNVMIKGKLLIATYDQ